MNALSDFLSVCGTHAFNELIVFKNFSQMPTVLSGPNGIDRPYQGLLLDIPIEALLTEFPSGLSRR